MKFLDFLGRYKYKVMCSTCTAKICASVDNFYHAEDIEYFVQY